MRNRRLWFCGFFNNSEWQYQTYNYVSNQFLKVLCWYFILLRVFDCLSEIFLFENFYVFEFVINLGWLLVYYLLIYFFLNYLEGNLRFLDYLLYFWSALTCFFIFFIFNNRLKVIFLLSYFVCLWLYIRWGEYIFSLNFFILFGLMFSI